MLDLAEGQYLMACLIASPDGVQHLAKGMLKPFRVSPAAQAATRVPAQRPAAA